MRGDCGREAATVPIWRSVSEIHNARESRKTRIGTEACQFGIGSQEHHGCGPVLDCFLQPGESFIFVTEAGIYQSNGVRRHVLPVEFLLQFLKNTSRLQYIS